jgi:hypothetical protein
MNIPAYIWAISVKSKEESFRNTGRMTREDVKQAEYQIGSYFLESSEWVWSLETGRGRWFWLPLVVGIFDTWM